jgi:hypothetical protein
MHNKANTGTNLTKVTLLDNEPMQKHNDNCSNPTYSTLRGGVRLTRHESCRHASSSPEHQNKTKA